jgi:glycosyltransferase involved in cell wall biosynthesis
MSSQRQLVFIVPGDINMRTGGYRYDKRIIDELRARDWQVRLVSLNGDFPFPTDQQLDEASRKLDELDDKSCVIIDGLAYSVMPEQLATHVNRLTLIALIHHPLALETDLTPVQSDSLQRLETQSLAFAHHVITTSESTAQALSDYQVPSSRISFVCPGVDAASTARGSNTAELNLLCVATLTHRKGHAVLIKALKLLEHRAWHLNCAGSLERDLKMSDQLIAQRSTLGLSERITFLGELDDDALQTQYMQADLFVLPSFHEGYGMVLDEAISYGLPIIASDAGAIRQTVPTGAGLLVPPGNPEALAEALNLFIDNEATRDGLREHAFAARSNQRSWKQAALEFEAALDFD